MLVFHWDFLRLALAKLSSLVGRVGLAYIRAHVHVFSVYATDTNRHTDSKKSRRRPTKKLQAPYLAKRGLELFGRGIFAEHQVSRSLVRDSGRKQS